jgi:putative OPT family oligopeptide transporter
MASLPPDATPDQRDRHWYNHVYAGDRMPQLTLRAVMMGGILGMLMSASNLYTTLTIGWAFGVAITACVMSYVIWSIFRILSGTLLVAIVTGGGVVATLSIVGYLASQNRLAPMNAAIVGGGISVVLVLAYVMLRKRLSPMSLLENNCMQSAASAAGYSTGSTIATMFGALLLLQKGEDSKLIETFKVQPWWLVGLFTLCTGLMGVFLAIPMKRQMINHEQLPFPSGIAAAETLRSLYSESKEAVQKAYSLVIALLCGAVVGVLNTAEDTLSFLDNAMNWLKEKGLNLRLPESLPEHGFFTRNGKSMIGSGFEPSVLLIAAGMIVGLRVSITMLVGSLFLYGVVAPWLIDMDAANAGVKGYIPSIELVGGGQIFHVYRWALWGGTALMVFSSLTALAFQWRTIGRAVAGAISGRKETHADSAEMAKIEVPFFWMVLGMVPITIAMVILQVVAFEITWWAGCIAVAMSFLLSLVACRATGETDTTPIGAMGKVMQLMFAVLAPKSYVANLASAGIAANSASSSADLLTDLKSGYLLGANARKQFLAQFFGVFFGTIAIVPVWYLMVPTKAALEKYPAPGTQSWYRVAQVLTEGISSLPDSAKWAILIGAVVGIVMPIIERFVPAKFKPYFPSAMGLGLSWVVPFANALAFAIGAFIAWVWSKAHKSSHSVFNIPIASGLVAGESLIKAIIAMTATLIGIFSAKGS